MRQRVEHMKFGKACIKLHDKYFIRSKSRQEKTSFGTKCTTIDYMNKPWQRISFTHIKLPADIEIQNHLYNNTRRPMISLNIDNFPVSISSTRRAGVKAALLSLQNFNSVKRTLSHLPINDQLRYENIICQVFSAIIHENVDNLPSVEEIDQAREMYNHNKTAKKLIDLSIGTK